MKILIIGAGLGGLVAGLALRQRGFDVEIHESAPQLGEVGAGLTLSRGAQRGTGFSESQTTCRALEQRLAQMRFELGDLPAQRRLAAAERNGRAAE